MPELKPLFSAAAHGHSHDLGNDSNSPEETPSMLKNRRHTIYKDEIKIPKESNLMSNKVPEYIKSWMGAAYAK
jgi:hypothetical protein